MIQKIKNLENKLINNKEEINSMNLLIDSVFVTKMYISTFGDFERVKDWKDKDKKNYMRRYNLNDEEVNININLVRDYKL